MDRSNILAGAPFRASAWAASLFLVLLLGTGTGTYLVVRGAILADLENQIVEEQLLLQEVYREGGLPRLIETIGQLDTPIALARRAVGLFGPEGRRLAGNLPEAPDFENFERRQLSLANAPGSDDSWYLNASHVDKVTIVVGRDLAPVLAAERTLFRVLGAAGLLVMAGMLAVGWRFSRGSLAKLQTIELALDRVAGGDDQARLPVGVENDQIDRIARRMNVHLDRLASLMGGLRSTAFAVAHELRTPLTRAFIAIQSARADAAADAGALAALDETEAELVRLGTIFDTILRIARIEAGSAATAAEPTDLGAVVADIAATFLPVAEERGHRLLVRQSPPDLPLVSGDPWMLGQLVANLVQNAITHCAPGATIRLATYDDGGGGVVLEVADDGPGIPEAERSAVFAAFRRLDPSTAGSGLGLTLVRAVADRHGAEVRLSDAAPGLRVTVRFPAAPGGRACPRAAAATEGSRIRKPSHR